MATFFLLLIYITFISLGLPDSLLGAAWPVMRVEFGAPLDAAGIIAMLISGATILSSLLSERLIRRFGTGVITAVSVLITSLCLMGIGFAPSFWFMVALAVPLGLGAGTIDAALNNYVALHYAARHMSWLHSFWGVGAFGGPLILAFFMARESNWRGGYIAIAAIQLSIAALLIVTLPLWKKVNTGPTNKPLPVKQEEPAPAPLTTGAVLKIPGVSMALLTFVMYCALEYAIGLWGSSFLVEARGFTKAAAASGVALYYGGITAGRFISGFLTARLRSSQLIRIGLIIVFAGVILLCLPLPAFLAPVIFFIIGLGCAPVFPSMIHETPYRFGKENSQKIIGMQMASAYTGSTFIPPIVGLLAEKTSTAIIPFALLLFGSVTFFCSEAVMRKTRKSPH